MPLRKSTGSTATKIRMCGVIWIMGGDAKTDAPREEDLWGWRWADAASVVRLRLGPVRACPVRRHQKAKLAQPLRERVQASDAVFVAHARPPVGAADRSS